MGAASDNGSRGAGGFRVATLNLWGWFGDWPRRLDMLESVWPLISADVLLVQEARFVDERDQARQVADALGYPHFVQGRAHTDADGEEGVAILARVPLKDMRLDELPTSEPRRCLISATAELGSQSVRFGCAHTVFAPEQARDGQIDAVCALAGDRVVVGGDLNAEPPAVQPRAACHGLLDSLAGDHPTWPVCPETFAAAWSARNGRAPHFSLEPRRLDYLLSRGLELEASRAVALGDDAGGFVSDHAAVWADYRESASVPDVDAAAATAARPLAW